MIHQVGFVVEVAAKDREAAKCYLQEHLLGYEWTLDGHTLYVPQCPVDDAYAITGFGQSFDKDGDASGLGQVYRFFNIVGYTIERDYWKELIWHGKLEYTLTGRERDRVYINHVVTALKGTLTLGEVE